MVEPLPGLEVLAAGPCRRPLLEEGADALLCLRRERVACHNAFGVLVRPVFVEVDLCVERFLADADG